MNFPDGLQDTSVHWNQQVQDGTLYVAFNSIQNRNTEYFVAGSDTVQVTGYGTTESTGILEFKVALWELSEDKATTSYVAGTTVYFPTGGECSTYTISGLTPGRLYKANVSYDSGMFYITGGVKIEGHWQRRPWLPRMQNNRKMEGAHAERSRHLADNDCNLQIWNQQMKVRYKL